MPGIACVNMGVDPDVPVARRTRRSTSPATPTKLSNDSQTEFMESIKSLCQSKAAYKAAGLGMTELKKSTNEINLHWRKADLH